METSEAVIGGQPALMGKTGLLTYERYYGLAEKPFSLSTRPGLLYRSESHAPVYDDLLMAIQRREGLIALTGEIGTGKTTLCRSVLAGLDRKTFTTFVPDPFLTREDLLKMLLVDFGVVSVDDLVRGRLAGASRPDLSYPLYEFLRSLEPIDAFAVLIIDEAQHLPLPLLEEIRILSDLEGQRKLLQVVLIGQPELRDALALPHMRQVRQRVSMHRDLQPLSRDGVAGYVDHRLALAGAGRDQVAFTDEGIDRVFAASGGVPRVVNLICDRALHHGALRRSPRIGPELVATAVADLRMAAGTDLPVTPRSAEGTATPHGEGSRTAGVPGGRASAPAQPAAGSIRKEDPAPADAAGQPEPAPLPADQGSEFELLLTMAPTVVRRGPPPVAPLRERRREPARSAAQAAPPEPSMPMARRVPALVVLALTALGVLAGGSVAVYVLWMRPLLRAETALPPVESKRSSADASPMPAPPVPSPGPADEATEAPEVQPQAAVVPAAPASVAWAVQVGAFASQARVDAMRADLSARGFETLEQQARGGELTVVLAGPYPSADEAEHARAQLRERPGFEGALVRRLTTGP